MSTPSNPLGDASPIVDEPMKLYNKVKSFFSPTQQKPEAAPTVDPYHSQKLAEANDSFRKSAETPTQPTGKTPTTRKVLRKAPTKR